VDISEWIDWNIYFGLVHSRSWESFLNQLHTGDTVFDIGANVGEITCRIAQRVGKEGNVYSFEPQPQNFARLIRNLALNHYQNVRPEQLALGSSRGTIIMAPRDSLNSGTQRIVEMDSPGKESNFILMTTLDDFVETNMIERLDSLKIDVEGYEPEVLKGAIRTIRHFHPTILIEVVDRFLQERGGSARELLQMLEEEGYQLVDAATSAPVGSRMQSIPAMFDVLATVYGEQRKTK
jgi:FkbM family methyltransferase